MNENKGKETHEPVPKTIVGTKAATASKWKKWLARKWVFPAMYMAAAAIILALMWVIQDSGRTSLDAKDLVIDPNVQNEQTTDAEKNLEVQPVQVEAETMQWPIVNRTEVEVIMPFFEVEASNEQKQAAMVEQDDTFIPSMGVALSRPDNQPFDVVAAMSGVVTRSENVPSVGNLVEITHDNELVTVYYSLSDPLVAKGDEVKQGDIIAKAGRNEIEKNLGVHLHFQVISNGQPINPETMIVQQVQ